MKKHLTMPFRILASLFGTLSWTAPPWLLRLAAFARSHRRSAAAALTLLVVAGIAWTWYDSLPGPLRVQALTDGVRITPNRPGAEPGPLEIRFAWDFSALHPEQPKPVGQPSVARIDLVDEAVVDGISISPAMAGAWRWQGDRLLRFEPAADWPAGTAYRVEFDPSILAADTRLSSRVVEFVTPRLTADVASLAFYQDPTDAGVRRVVSTLRFSHPVEPASLERHLDLAMRPANAGLETPPRPIEFSVTYDDNRREAYVQSRALELPPNPAYLKLTLAAGVRSALGGEPSAQAVDGQVLVPDRFSFLKVDSAALRIVRNPENVPEQTLSLEFTDAIARDELTARLRLYLLPASGQFSGRSHWRSPREVTAQVLADSEAVPFRLLPNERDFSTLYSLVVDVPEARYLYLRIDEGLRSVNDFVQRDFYDHLLRAPAYPREVSIAGEGSILSHSGEQQLGVSTRGLDAVKLVVGKLLPGQINHLVSQTDGDISAPRFVNWNFNQDNITEIDSLLLELQPRHPRDAVYFSIDLHQYLPRDTARFGLFFVDIIGWDRQRDRAIRDAADRRLVLVTDLGIIVKNNDDGSHDLFVQSIASGEPVAGARIELLGKNGMALLDGRTDGRGHLALPPTRGLERERQPTVYVVRAGADLSFIPYARGSRQINLSRFDIGGVVASQYDRDTLNAFVFSDRGLYRPGETVNLGMIVKHVDLSNVEGIPLEVVIVGPRGNEAQVRRISLPQKGFFDFRFATEPASPTGGYQANLHLVRDNNRRGRQLASRRFELAEFQPQTMKIESRWLDADRRGWFTGERLVAQVTLGNLFGTPAQDRRVSGRMVIEPHDFRFEAFPDYRFTDPHFRADREPLSLDQALPEQRTDADGEARFTLPLDGFREGTYRLGFVAEGFDADGGRSVQTRADTLISPLSTIVGYRADGDLDFINAGSERRVEFIAVDPDLARTRAGDLRLRLLEIQQVSTLVRQGDGTYRYQTVAREVERSAEALEIGADGLRYALDSATPGDFALEVIDAQGLRLARLEYSVVGFANLDGRIDRSAELQLKLDKADYFPGETIEMSIRAPYAGAGLITIESDRVHAFKWFRSASESTLQTIRVPRELEGSGYVNVAFVRDAESPEVFTSPLSYAVQPFSIDRSRRRIDIELDSAPVARPGKPMRIGFSASQPSRIAIFAADEGILQAAGYGTPRPLDHFLQKRALTVGTLQILDLILPEFELLRARSAAGGGMAEMRAAMLAQNLNPFRRRSDRPAVFWGGIHDADAERRELTFDVPETFAGQLRIMAVAVGDSAVGSAATSSLVRGPFVISPNLLTAAAPGDEFRVTVGIANIIEGSGQAVPIDVEISASEHLELLGDTRVRLEIDEGGEGRHAFRVRALPRLGSAEIRVEAIHGDESGARSASLSVRPATRHQTRLQTGHADGGFELEVPRRLLPELSRQTITASASPLAIVDGLTAYLEHFPHGCTEQVVSQVFPLVGLAALPAFAPRLTGIEARFARLIDRLRERQLPDGGFAFWPGHSRAAEYPSVYVMHFLVEAAARGHAVPGDLLRRGQAYLEQLAAAGSANLGDARTRANAIYLLTRMGAVTTNYLVDLEEGLSAGDDDWRRDITSAYMAATYRLLQRDDAAQRLIDGFEPASDRHRAFDDFHSRLAVDAQYLFLLARHFPARAAALDAARVHDLTREVFEGRYNTIAAAYTILALGAYSERVAPVIGAEQLVMRALDEAGNAQLLQPRADPFPSAAYGVDARRLEIEAARPLYYVNLQAGYDRQLPAAALAEGLEIHRDFVDDDGRVVTRFAQGRELTARIRVRALGQRRLHNIAVVDLLPGGFEVRRASVSRSAPGWRADYVDVREDRVVYYGSFDQQVRELRYRVRPTSAGEFVVPPAYAASMYDRSLRAHTAPGRFTVEPAP